MAKMTVRDIEVSGKRVLVRVDFNVPMNYKTGEITDDSRIRASLPTIHYLIERDARVILISHLGRPDGKIMTEYRLTPIAQRLSQILGQQVGVATDCIGSEVEKSVETLKAGDILLLENLRFHPDEETGSRDFARALARLGDVFVNDAFGTSHRAHASIAGIARFLPAVAGLLLEKEITFLGHVLENPSQPFAALIGGAKISDKVKMLERISDKVDYMLIGGGMAATFLKAKGYEIGKSIFEADRMSTATLLFEKAENNGIKIVLPTDVVVADEVKAGSPSLITAVDKIPADKRVIDIGPQTIEQFCDILQKCKTIFWNGPMGVYEIPEFARGTQEMARLLSTLEATTIIGGGSTAEVVADMKLDDRMTFVSTGGGASLSFVSGEKLPGVEVLMDKK